MRRWGIVVTACYALLLLVFSIPLFVLLLRRSPTFPDYLSIYLDPFPWAFVLVLAGSQALLLFLSVDTSFRKLRPRRHLAVTVALTSFFAALLFVAGVLAFDASMFADQSIFGESMWKNPVPIFLPVLLGLWLTWAVVFYLHLRGSPQPVSAAVAWLLKGSVMELLIAVPAHVVVRQRGDCSAPIVTSFGIVTGIAVMLLAFGPGVLALYKKKYDTYRKAGA